jgi:hypothetical protein
VPDSYYPFSNVGAELQNLAGQVIGKIVPPKASAPVGPPVASRVRMQTRMVDLTDANHSSEATALVLGISANAIRCSLLIDTSTGKVTTDGYAFIKLNSDDGFNPLTLFHTVHGNSVDGQCAIWYPQQAQRQLYITYWTDTPSNPVEMQRG